MTREKAIKHLGYVRDNNIPISSDAFDALSMAISALEAEPCENCISSQAAIDALQKEINKGKPPFDDIIGSIRCGVRLARNIIEDLPSVQPERKRGQWIYNSPVTMKCDQCGLVIKDWDWHRFKFCPNCDCDMRGEQNG